MKRAIEISRTALTTPGTEPFGAVIVLNGKIVGEGLNRALATLDVTSHGEIEAIRDANRRLKRLDLSDCEIYTSCEPCPLCVAAIGIARLKKMYYAAARDRTDIAKSRHIGWVAIHDMKFTISILYLPVTEILCCQ